ncbi:MAG TPA: cytochrome P450, partial [Tepidiformaceae bacterium]|nr:cytochrome P450 [Tepidiformaceae bacterium]
MPSERDMQPISIFSAATREDPYPVYTMLREEHPVYREPVFGTYVLTRFKDVYDVLKDHGTFSSAQGISPGLQSTSGAMMTTMITSDPPRHTRLRALVNRSFTPRVLQSLEPWLVSLVDDILDGWESNRDIDVVETLTVPVPVAAIARLLGISAEDTERFKEWSDAVVGATDGGLPEESRKKIGDMMRYFAAEIAERRQSPRDDLVSTITFAEVDGERLTDLEMLSFCLLLLVAGNETTTNLLSNLLAVLSQRPDLWALLRREPERTQAAVDEALRHDSPVQML